MWNIFLALVITIWFVQISHAAEHGGTAVTTQEHGGTTQPSAAPAAVSTDTAPVATAPATTTSTTPSADDIRAAISTYIKEQTDEGGNFDIYDPQTQETRELIFVKVHDRVGKTGSYYYSCADFTDKNSSDKLDLDFDAEDTSGKLKVVDVRIHKVNDVARYTYDDKDNRIPVAAAPTATAPAPAGDMGSSTKHEHGGKEHGGN